MSDDLEFFDDIFSSLEREEKNSIPEDELEEIILYVCSQTGLDKYRASLITKYFFEEIRSLLLNGKDVRLQGLGTFRFVNFNKNIFIKFKPNKILLKSLNKS